MNEQIESWLNSEPEADPAPLRASSDQLHQFTRQHMRSTDRAVVAEPSEFEKPRNLREAAQELISIIGVFAKPLTWLISLIRGTSDIPTTLHRLVENRVTWTMLIVASFIVPAFNVDGISTPLLYAPSGLSALLFILPALILCFLAIPGGLLFTRAKAVASRGLRLLGGAMVIMAFIAGWGFNGLTNPERPLAQHRTALQTMSSTLHELDKTALPDKVGSYGGELIQRGSLPRSYCPGVIETDRGFAECRDQSGAQPLILPVSADHGSGEPMLAKVQYDHESEQFMVSLRQPETKNSHGLERDEAKLIGQKLNWTLTDYSASDNTAFYAP